MSNESITSREESVFGDYKRDESVFGDYKLGAVVKRSPDSTVYQTEFRGYDGQKLPAVIKVRELDNDAALAEVRRYRRAMRLEHPNLLRLYAAGTSPDNGLTTAWVVMERADESLAGVLAERALSEDEVGEMLRPTVAALAYLHKNGFAHGAVKPSNVLACGDELRLSCDNVIPVSDGGAPAADVLALGTLISESLTERGPHGVIRHPAGRYAEIVRHCAEPDPAKRWTAARIATLLEQKAAEPEAEPEPLRETPAAVAAPAFSRPQPESHPTPKWIFAALAVVVLAVLLFAVQRKTADTPKPAAVPKIPAVSAVTPPAPVIEPAPPAPKKAKPFPEPPVAAVGRKAGGWSVIVAAYGSREAAEKRKDSLAKRWPAFHLQVSEHNSERAPWLVTVGENLSEDQAESLRARAANTGLAHDAYIKRMK